MPLRRFEPTALCERCIPSTRAKDQIISQVTIKQAQLRRIIKEGIDTHRKGGIVKVVLKHCVKITEESMLWCVIASITEVYTSQKGRNLSIISICLCIYKNTFLMVCKQGSNNLHGFYAK